MIDMKRENVDEMLRNYRANKGRCEHLALMMPIAEGALLRLREDVVDARAQRVQRYEQMAMPGRKGAGDPTGEMGAGFADGEYGGEERVLMRQIERMRAEREECSLRVKFVDAWLEALTQKERWLVVQHEIEGRFWREIVLEWGKVFGEELSRDHLRKLKASAMSHVYKIAI